MSYSAVWRDFIPKGGMNDVIADWHAKQPEREQSVASPSTLTECPRVVWLKKHRIHFTNDMGWGRKQRMMLGRITEGLFAEQLKDEGKLLFHWADGKHDAVDKFGMGEGLSRIEGVPDLLIKLGDTVLISDAKTSRADSFGYVPIESPAVWDDELWYKYKLQVEAYYLLCHKNARWFRALELPLPTACHLFSYALDDGVVKREFTWRPSQQVASEIIHYANRWNKAYYSPVVPPCQCTATQTKFCQYAADFEITRNGAKLGTACCGEELSHAVV